MDKIIVFYERKILKPHKLYVSFKNDKWSLTSKKDNAFKFDSYEHFEKCEFEYQNDFNELRMKNIEKI